ncbi:MAG: glycosyltransferase, partial [Deltaproteobacteria bacterium]
MLRVAVGVMVYNEAANLGSLVETLLRPGAPALAVEALVVVSSGSTDASVPIAREVARTDARVHVIDDAERRGKATAINQFLGALGPGLDVAVLASGDVIPGEHALARLVMPFAEP